MTYKTFKDIVKEEDPNEDTIPMGQAIVFGVLFLAVGWAYYFIMQ